MTNIKLSVDMANILRLIRQEKYTLYMECFFDTFWMYPPVGNAIKVNKRTINALKDRSLIKSGIRSKIGTRLGYKKIYSLTELGESISI
jgi:hypothetical protein